MSEGNEWKTNTCLDYYFTNSSIRVLPRESGNEGARNDRFRNGHKRFVDQSPKIDLPDQPREHSTLRKATVHYRKVGAPLINILRFSHRENLNKCSTAASENWAGPQLATFERLGQMR